MRRLLGVVALVAGVHAGAAVPLAPRALGPSAYGSRAPLVAGTGSRFLTVWQEELGDAGARVLAVPSNSAGAAIGLPALLFGDAAPIALAASGDSFALLYSHGFPRIQAIAEIDADGVVRASHDLHLPPGSVEAMAWNGSRFLLAWYDGGGTRVATVDESGHLRSTPLDIPFPRLFASGDSFFAVTTTPAGLLLHRIDSDGALAGTTVLDAGSGSFVAAARPDGGIAAAWRSATAPGTIVVGRISRDGRVSSETLPVGGEPVALLDAGHDVLLAYFEYTQDVPPVRRLSIRRVDGDSNPRVLSTNAWNYVGATAGDVLLIARHSGSIIETFAVDASGDVTGPELISIERARQLPPVLGSGGGGVVAVWTELAGDTTTVRSATVTTEGMPVSWKTIAGPKAALVASDLSWNGAEYVTIVAIDGRLRAQRLDRLGRRAGNATDLGESRPGMHVTVAWAGDRWIAMWPWWPKVRIASILPNGLVESIVERDLAAMRPPRQSAVIHTAIAFDGERGVVAWIEAWVGPCSSGCPSEYAAFAASIDRNGALLDGPRLLAEKGVESIGVTSAPGGQFAIAYGYAVYSHMNLVPHTAVMLFPSGVERTFASPAGGPSAIVWDGRHYLLAARGRERMVLHRLASNLTEVAPAREIVLPRADAGGISIAAPLTGTAVIGTQVSPLSDPGADILIREDELRPVAPVRRRRVGW